MARDFSQELSSVVRLSPEDGSTTDTSVSVAARTLLVVELVDRAGLFERFGDQKARLAGAEIGGRPDDLDALAEEARRAGYQEIALRAERLRSKHDEPTDVGSSTHR